MKIDLSSTVAPLKFEKRVQEVEIVKRKIDRVSQEFTQTQFDLTEIFATMTGSKQLTKKLIANKKCVIILYQIT